MSHPPAKCSPHPPETLIIGLFPFPRENQWLAPELGHFHGSFFVWSEPLQNVKCYYVFPKLLLLDASCGCLDFGCVRGCSRNMPRLSRGHGQETTCTSEFCLPSTFLGPLQNAKCYYVFTTCWSHLFNGALKVSWSWELSGTSDLICLGHVGSWERLDLGCGWGPFGDPFKTASVTTFFALIVLGCVLGVPWSWVVSRMLSKPAQVISRACARDYMHFFMLLPEDLSETPSKWQVLLRFYYFLISSVV